MTPSKPPVADVRVPVLPRVHVPADLRQLSIEELEQLCGELRTVLWDTITTVGGHLAASLGVVELTVALHYVYDTPRDKLVWDVGHQGYIHKILTGRRERLATIRQYGGLSGFLKRGESEYDTFGAGHASTSISAALGMAVARDLHGEDHSVVAIIGDGGMTGGLAYEALNNAGASGRNITVVLNDNGMSISPNVGGISRFFLKMERNPRMSKLKDEIWRLLGESPVAAKRLQRLAGKLEGSLKNLLSPGMLFEDMGFQYFGPFDGHNLREVIDVLTDVKNDHHHPALVHLVTVKGKGIECAEADPIKYHGVKGRPLPAKVEPRAAGDATRPPTMAYMDIFGRAVIGETARDPDVVVITAAMKEGTGLVEYSLAYPQNFFDVGIAEGHAVTFASGLAASGLKPVVAVYSTFLQRAYDHMLHDCALQHLPVLFCLDRAGLVGEDGPTHHGCFDLAYLSSIPHMVVAAPRSGEELRDLIRTGLEYRGGPMAVRYPRDKAPDVIDWTRAPRAIRIGSWEVLREGKRVLVLAVGTMVEVARRAIASEELHVTLVNCRFIKPLDEELLSDLLARHECVLTLEEGSIEGGFGSRIAFFMKEHGLTQPFAALALPDQFVTHGGREKLLEVCGLSDAQLAEVIRGMTRGEMPVGGRSIETVLVSEAQRVQSGLDAPQPGDEA
ncbi:MAG: 1-deoxy-D-xylulose-5-phosphate synthase [bacterium]|nr:1-deoxy-D-xylulose-5-phosphate synthase [bacterium]